MRLAERVGMMVVCTLLLLINANGAIFYFPLSCRGWHQDNSKMSAFDAVSQLNVNSAQKRTGGEGCSAGNPLFLPRRRVSFKMPPHKTKTGLA